MGTCGSGICIRVFIATLVVGSSQSIACIYIYIFMFVVRYMDLLSELVGFHHHSLPVGCFSRIISCISRTPKCNLSP